ncbi:MAG: hypothetical protein ABI972_20490 [Acidobacteriota bacterium]
MIFDAFARPGNTTTDIFGALATEPAPAGLAGAGLVFPMAVSESAVAAMEPNSVHQAETFVEGAPFFTIFEDVGSGQEAVATEEEAGTESESEGEDHTLEPKAANEIVAPKTLRLIFPVHYFYTEVHLREAVPVNQPEPKAATPSVQKFSHGISNVFPAMRPTRPPESSELAQPTVSTDQAFETAAGMNIVAEGEPQPQPKPAAQPPDHAAGETVARRGTRVNLEPELQADPPSQNPADPQIERPTPDGEVRDIRSPTAVPTVVPPQAPREAVTPARFTPPQETQRVSAPVGWEQSNLQEYGQRREAEPKASGVKPDPVDLRGKEGRKEREEFATHLQEKSPSPEVLEHASRHVLAPPRPSGEPASSKAEASIQLQSVPKASVEPMVAQSPVRTVAIAIEGPRGEDVRAIVQSTGDGVQVRLQAGDHRTQQALELGAPELRHRLEEVQRVSSGDVWEGTQRAGEAIGGAHAPDTGLGGQQEPGQRGNSPTRDDDTGGQRHGQRGFGRGQQHHDAEGGAEEFATQFEQGGRL